MSKTSIFYAPKFQELWSDKNTHDPKQISTGSHIEIMLHCPHCDHSWTKLARDWIRNPDCPRCWLRDRNKVQVGVNDLVTTHPKSLTEWDYDQNPFPPDCYTRTSKTRIRLKGKPVPVVIAQHFRRQDESGSEIPPKSTPTFAEHPSLLNLWSKNNPDPSTVTIGSSSRGSFTCSLGHDWEMEYRIFFKRNGRCPFCASKNAKVMEGFNDLKTTHPDLYKQLVTPMVIGAWSYTPVMWKCDNQHQWEATPNQRTVRKTGCPYCAGKKAVKGFNDLETVCPKVAKWWHPSNSLQPDEIVAGSEIPVAIICEGDTRHVWNTYAYNLKKRFSDPDSKYLCTQCSSISSRGEQELASFVKSIEPESVVNTRKIISPNELDIYVPSKKVAIEFNGIYWHSEAQNSNTNYHHEKWLRCKEKGIHLIQVWEDDWMYRPEIVKKMIAHKLQADRDQIIGARKTQIQVVSSEAARGFLEQHHIQGNAGGSLRLGLVYQEELVALIVVQVNKESAYLVRYATSTRVPGGFTRLIKAVRQHLPSSVKQLVTFASHDVSDGALYENNGFTADKELPPDYSYVVDRQRVHKFNYRLKRFHDDPELRYDPALSESQLALLNGLTRCWDSGKTRYVMDV